LPADGRSLAEELWEQTKSICNRFTSFRSTSNAIVAENPMPMILEEGMSQFGGHASPLEEFG